MGICFSKSKNEKTKNSPKRQNSVAKAEKIFNPNSSISGIIGQNLVKHINDINGDAINIDKCIDSTIIILDYSSQVIIQECKNCNFFIAPCKGSISIRNSENINIISASHQFRCTNVINCIVSIYSTTTPTFEKIKNFNLSCFFFMYVELPDLFIKADLSPWNNCWSEYQLIGREDHSEIKYFEAKSDSNFLKPFFKVLKDLEIYVDNYFPVPYTNGLYFTISKKDSHSFLIFREFSIDHKLYELLNKDELILWNTSLVRTVIVDRNDKEVIQMKSLLTSNVMNSKCEFFNENNLNVTNKKTNKSSNLNVSSVNNPNKIESSLSHNKFVILWLVNNHDNFIQFQGILENSFDNYLMINQSDLGPGKLHDFIKKYFINYSF